MDEILRHNLCHNPRLFSFPKTEITTKTTTKMRNRLPRDSPVKILHIIPRHPADVPDPRGGIRWVISDKARYWK